MPCCRFRRAERCGMPQQCSYPAKTKFDSTHVVVQGQAEQVCIVVRVCCVCGQWVQQKCLYYVPQLTVLRSQRTTPEKCKVLCPPCWQATHPGKMRSCQVHAKIFGTVSSPALSSMVSSAVDGPTSSLATGSHSFPWSKAGCGL